MSHGSHSQYRHEEPRSAPAHPAASRTHTAPKPRQHHAAQQQHRAASSDYTLAHGGRRVRIGPVVFWSCIGALVIMAGWSLMTVTYFAFKDDVLTRLIARQAEMQFAYEDRIAEMRTQVDRITSRQLLDQEQIEQKLDQIARRQATLESRAATLGTFADPTPTGSIRPSVRDGASKPAPLGEGAAAPVNDRGARLETKGAISAFVARFTGKSASGGLTGTLARLNDSLERVETKQLTSLASIEDGFNNRAKRMRGVLTELGLDAGKAPPAEATGGPFVPVRINQDQNTFEKRLQRISVARSHVERLNKTMVSVPVRQPLHGELDLSSGFGVRVDPFFRRPAMHTGLDFRGDSGDPVRATAVGTVTHAGWQGGYGKLVEIDHGNGLSTRYGHLSEIGVRVGQSIKIGQIIGRIGSTGRSTGPHLHYETRVDGDAVDPHKFLRAGAKLGFGS
ncbi:MAG TPA: peptidoglycan DD-metalloendopeptidase family protein [Xanthobacteraceae bacterium]|nr:peptidoglycan DD-metalloendopeptidase family protein [Xanthobacteraceae bacterium]